MKIKLIFILPFIILYTFYFNALPNFAIFRRKGPSRFSIRELLSNSENERQNNEQDETGTKNSNIFDLETWKIT